jgi:hypothetical protein
LDSVEPLPFLLPLFTGVRGRKFCELLRLEGVLGNSQVSSTK